MPLPESIASARRKAKLTQKELAEKLGIDRLSVSRWEQGGCRPSIPHLLEIARILKVSPNKLLG